MRLIPADPDLADAFATRTASLDGTYALAWVDGDGLHSLGVAPDDIAWSTIKVPLAIAALEHGDSTGATTTRRVEAAITRSDNDAAATLWSSLGSPQEAARAVDEVLTAYDSAGTRTERESDRPGFSPYGQTRWSVKDQARFAAGIACAADDSTAGQVRATMGRTVPDQRWGIGQLDSAHIKGGWGPDLRGAYTVRQFGDATVGDRLYALAVIARADAGTYTRGAADLSDLLRWWAQDVAPDAPPLTCPESR